MAASRKEGNMETINQLSYVLQGILLGGLGFRFVYICIRMQTNHDDAPHLRKRLKNTVVMAVISQLIFSVKDLLVFYYGNGY